MNGPFTKSSFNTLLKVHEVMQFGELVTMFADTRTGIPDGEEQVRFRYGTVGPVVLRGVRRRHSMG